MTPDELREKVARAIADYELPVGPGWQDRWRDYFGTADAAIAVVLEEAARVAEDAAPVCQDMEATKIAERCDDIAAAIRALKGKV